MRRSLYVLGGFLFAAALAGCGSVEQMHRDNLRFGATKRGTETYRVIPEIRERAADGTVTKSWDRDSFSIGQEAARNEIVFYRDYKQIADPQVHVATITGKPESGAATPDGKPAGASDASPKPKPEAKQYPKKAGDLPAESESQAFMALMLRPPRTALAQPAIPIGTAGTGPQDPVRERELQELSRLLRKYEVSQAELFWPQQILKDTKSTTTTTEEGGKKTTTVTALNEEMVRALSSTTSVAQMRDLMTEPAFPSMLPMERHVELGCVLPPDSVAWEAAIKLEAAVKTKEVEGSLSQEYKSAVVKLFEESERTLFLQYALFRLCEMSVNAPAGFRNIYPVIIHDIVRRTAEMRQQDNTAIEARRAEEQKTVQKKLEDEIAAKAEKTQAEKTKTEQARKAAAEAEAALAAKRIEAANAEATARKEIAYQNCLSGGMAAAAGDSAKLEALEQSCQKFK